MYTAYDILTLVVWLWPVCVHTKFYFQHTESHRRLFWLTFHDLAYYCITSSLFKIIPSIYIYCISCYTVVSQLTANNMTLLIWDQPSFLDQCWQFGSVLHVAVFVMTKPGRYFEQIHDVFLTLTKGFVCLHLTRP